MSGRRTAAEPARHALLGLLLDGPSHGYDLLRRFDRAGALGDIVHMTASNLYALLARLEHEGAIAGEQQDAGTRPQRRVYRLTEEGRAAILTWLGTVVDHPRDMLIDFPLKLYLTRALGADMALDLIARQRSVFDAYIARLEALPQADAPPFDSAYVRLMRTGRTGRARAAIDWLDAAEALMREPQPPTG